MKKIVEFIKKTPKTELHLHIEGTLEPELLFKIANRNNIQIPFANVDEIKSAYSFDNLESFLKIFYQGSRVLIKEQDFFDLTWAYAKKCKDTVGETRKMSCFDPDLERTGSDCHRLARKRGHSTQKCQPGTLLLTSPPNFGGLCRQYHGTGTDNVGKMMLLCTLGPMDL